MPKKKLRNPLYEILKELAKDNLYNQLITQRHFEDLPIDEKQAIVKSFVIRYPTDEKLRKAAYQYLTKDILNNNLDPTKQRLEFISDTTHSHKVQDLDSVIDFILTTKHNKISEQLQSSSVVAGFFNELNNLRKNVSRSFLEIKHGPTHVLHSLDQAFTHSLNRARQYLKSDPTRRSWKNRGKQFLGGALNFTAWSLKQCVNIIRKPIAFAVNITKAVGNLILLKPSNSYSNLKDAAKDLRDSLVAGATVFLGVSFAPIATIPTAAIAFTAAVGAHSLASAIASTTAFGNWLMTPFGLVAQAEETAIKGAYLSAEYNRTSPNYTEKERGTLEHLYNIVKTSNDFTLRQGALEKMDHLHEFLKTNQLEKDKVGRIISKINSVFESEPKIKAASAALPTSRTH